MSPTNVHAEGNVHIGDTAGGSIRQTTIHGNDIRVDNQHPKPAEENKSAKRSGCTPDKESDEPSTSAGTQILYSYNVSHF